MAEKSLTPPPAAERDRAAFELLRVWVAEGDQHVSLRAGVFEDARGWGIVLADLARHIANAEALGRKGLNREEFLEQMLESFEAEIESPTEVDGEITQ